MGRIGRITSEGNGLVGRSPDLETFLLQMWLRIAAAVLLFLLPMFSEREEELKTPFDPHLSQQTGWCARSHSPHSWSETRPKKSLPGSPPQPPPRPPTVPSQSLLFPFIALTRRTLCLGNYTFNICLLYHMLRKKSFPRSYPNGDNDDARLYWASLCVRPDEEL